MCSGALINHRINMWTYKYASILLINSLKMSDRQLIWSNVYGNGKRFERIFLIHLILYMTYDRTIRYIFSGDLLESFRLSFSLSLSLSLYSLLHSGSLNASFLIWDDDLCHYFVIHGCTRGRVRVSYADMTCVYRCKYECG